MSVSGQAGYISFAVQTAKVGDGTFDPAAIAWLNHRALGADVAFQQFVDQVPPELGAGLFTAGSFKAGAYVAGGMALNARLDNAIAALLYGASGKATVGTAQVAGASSGSTIYSVDPADDTSMPWMALRKVIPGDTPEGYQEEFYYDCRVAALSITVPQMGMMTHELAFVGRVPEWIDGKPVAGAVIGTAPVFGAPFESAASVGQSAEGSISLPGFTSDELPGGGKFTSAQVILANQLSTPQEEMVIGSYHPVDFTPLSRGALVRLVYRWKDATLYRALHMLAASGGAPNIRKWNPVTKSSDVHVISQSQGLVPTFTNKHKFDFYAPSADWVMSPVQLAPKKLLQVEIIGTIKQASSGVASWQTQLWNAGALNAIYTA